MAYRMNINDNKQEKNTRNDKVTNTVTKINKSVILITKYVLNVRKLRM